MVTPIAEKAGWIFNPHYSPDGSHLAVYWNRKEPGIWTIDLRTGKTRLVLPTPDAYPKGWSADGKWVYVTLSGKPGVVTVPADGSRRQRTVLGLPEHLLGDVSLLDERRAVVNVTQRQSDIWLAEPSPTK